ncbi:hypothetical protein [Pseudonocardia abyssalis]|uniref:hypothetical protein n=1 Tax=Pseudonocardia abyssalis TaxID=2792008 RepID=UPI001CF6621B|nr:hypothetical protein [Pseudonocardia abyssalis]
MNRTATTRPDTDVGAPCSEPAAEPVSHVSPGSEELLHPNLIAWMVTQFVDLATAYSCRATQWEPNHDGDTGRAR